MPPSWRNELSTSLCSACNSGWAGSLVSPRRTPPPPDRTDDTGPRGCAGSLLQPQAVATDVGDLATIERAVASAREHSGCLQAGMGLAVDCRGRRRSSRCVELRPSNRKNDRLARARRLPVAADLRASGHDLGLGHVFAAADSSSPLPTGDPDTLAGRVEPFTHAFHVVALALLPVAHGPAAGGRERHQARSGSSDLIRCRDVVHE